ncbi:AAA+-type ATPase, SpoVK/Ycf46/Vps4 family [Modicisalibacter muralis]|uniref:AAA+-type ATPase, SpoVK/Ycf46/Vps4 family n=1 Tax=Modicisalibacter muralis TaxID=119000 RepID=A0A1G9F5A9_9GAMM|nr:ATP-binding protein [Halomonas muralis]SDK83566.1 AAA+-type ATPase, SpoVK/Ycf46/Vps4 family [Halomonas muralis]
MRWESLLDTNWMSTSNEADEVELSLAQLIALKLVSLHGNPSHFDESDWKELFNWLGMDVEETLLSNQPAAAILRKVQARRRLHELSPLKGRVDTALVGICEQFAKVFGLNETERDLTILAWLNFRHNLLRDLCDSIEIHDFSQIAALIAGLIGHSPRQVSQALHCNGPLMRFEILEAPHSTRDLLDATRPGNTLENLAPLLVEDCDNPEVIDKCLSRLLIQLCPRVPVAVLPLHSFSYVSQLQLIVDYLKRALSERRSGANVLLYGAPGVGKTALARALGQVLGGEMFEVPVEDEKQQPYEPATRLNRYRMAQRLLEGRSNALLLFDEIEDAFAGKKQVPKAWTNQVLERNTVPGLWLSNSVIKLDPAFLRRFDLIIEIKPQSSKRGHPQVCALLQNLPILMDAKKRLAKQSWMTPAIAHQLAELGALLPAHEPLRNQRRLKAVLRERLRALGENDLALNRVFDATLSQPSTVKRLMPDYRLTWLNTQPALSRVTRQVQRRGCARLCLHGPSGSGKTALATYLADLLGRPLVKAHASTLLDMFVGGTEQKLAELFENARDRGAVLLLDEADTFLMNRARADQSWEVSQVNELLVQLENFDGVFIATTNRFEYLDHAVMRRFDLKVGFDFLKITQLRELLQEVIPERDRKALAALSDNQLAAYSLTPGNIYTALDQLDLRGCPLRLNSLLKALELEQQTRQGHGNRMPIGFINSHRPMPVLADKDRHAARRE